MHSPSWLRGVGLVLAVLIPAAGAFLPARADVVILKDGHVLQGKVKRESEVIVEAGGVPYEVPKQFFLVDDGVRRVIFGSRQVEDVEPSDPSSDPDFVMLRREVVNIANFAVPSPLQVVSVTPWDSKWERTVQIRGPNTAAAVGQRITLLTPYLLRADSLRYRWPVLYLTREYDPVTIRGLLIEHPTLKLKGDAEDVLRRFRVFRFLLQAGWLDAAEQELAGIEKDFPAEKEKLADARAQLRRLRAVEIVREVQRAHDAGRARWVREVMTLAPALGLDEKQQERLRNLRTQEEAGRDRLAAATHFLLTVPPRIEQGTVREVFTQAASAMLAELTAASSARLDPFIALARQAERDRAQERPTAHGPDQLMALAVSGWLLGNSAADTRVDVAVRLWRARQFVLDYLRTPTEGERIAKLQAFLKGGPAGVDEVAQMARLLPPPEARGQEAGVSSQWLQISSNLLAASAHNLLALARLPLIPAPRPLTPVLKLQSDTPWSQRRGTEFWVQLPLEYQAGRLYPVLVALHQAGEGAEDILKRWGPLAAARGFVLVAPAWVRGFRGGYEFTPEEHAAVTDVLWEVRRRFWVDADRVFLTGFGEGANMAFDVGLTYPHLFAGVVPMGGTPRYFARVYKHNGQYLPFYVVEGDRNGKNPLELREHYKLWVARGYPVLYVEYKGRALEWFAGELPHALDWMTRQKRATGLPELGRGGGTVFAEGYTSMRPSDNRFYWLSADGLVAQHENDASRWRNILGATLAGRISEGNILSLTVKGFKRATAWFGPGMLDFDKPVTVRLNSVNQGGKRVVKPSLETLLNDLYLRGDRQRVYWAKLEF